MILEYFFIGFALGAVTGALLVMWYNCKEIVVEEEIYTGCNGDEFVFEYIAIVKPRRPPPKLTIIKGGKDSE